MPDQLPIFASANEPVSAAPPSPSAVTREDSPAARADLCSWREALAGEREQEYFLKLINFISIERAAGKTIYPQNGEIFNALTFTPLEQTKVVIVGQDPYHGPGQAHGLCFSVRPGVSHPPSLQNIFKEVSDDLQVPLPRSGCLEPWARQGVLLLNTVLTVESGKPQSHANLGWERFTDRVIHELNTRRKHLVFLLWGAHALRKCQNIDEQRHLVLKTVHPSPLSAHRGFLGCRHFSQANAYLAKHGITPIDWSL